MIDAMHKTIRLPLSGRNISVKYALVHAAYWLMITAFFIYEKKYMIVKSGLPSFVACISVRIALLIIVAYVNLHFLLPKYLIKGRYLKYFVLVFLSIAGYMLMQSLFDIFLYGYILGPMRQSYLWQTVSYNFLSTIWYIGIMVALKLSIDWYEQKRLLQKTAVEKLQAEVNYLRSQVNPHFLFNILNNLYSLTLKKSEKAPDVVLKLSEMMEYMLYDSDDKYVLLEKEIQYLENYFELEKLRYGDHTDIQLKKSGDISTLSIAPLLLLPLVENAFKHGVSRSASKAWLHCNIQVAAPDLHVTVENSKQAADSSNSNKGGIGLTNLKQRLELLYPGNHSLEIQDNPGSFHVSLHIHL
ncbi:MAG TPA: histidine kinase [Agriterribacter sp.]|nr:histidine kinase [Agriterribacter sp.]